jgi:hypothetical protein
MGQANAPDQDDRDAGLKRVDDTLEQGEADSNDCHERRDIQPGVWIFVLFQPLPEGHILGDFLAQGEHNKCVKGLIEKRMAVLYAGQPDQDMAHRGKQHNGKNTEDAPQQETVAELSEFLIFFYIEPEPQKEGDQGDITNETGQNIQDYDAASYVFFGQVFSVYAPQFIIPAGAVVLPSQAFGTPGAESVFAKPALPMQTYAMRSVRVSSILGMS